MLNLHAELPTMTSFITVFRVWSLNTTAATSNSWLIDNIIPEQMQLDSESRTVFLLNHHPTQCCNRPNSSSESSTNKCPTTPFRNKALLHVKVWQRDKACRRGTDGSQYESEWAGTSRWELSFPWHEDFWTFNKKKCEIFFSFAHFHGCF